MRPAQIAPARLSLLSRASRGLIRIAASIDPTGFADMALLEVAGRHPDTLKRFVLEKASAIATRAMIASWDREGVRHCAACPERFGLRSWNKAWLCQGHYKEVEARTSSKQP